MRSIRARRIDRGRGAGCLTYWRFCKLSSFVSRNFFTLISSLSEFISVFKQPTPLLFFCPTTTPGHHQFHSKLAHSPTGDTLLWYMSGYSVMTVCWNGSVEPFVGNYLNAKCVDSLNGSSRVGSAAPFVGNYRNAICVDSRGRHALGPPSSSFVNGAPYIRHMNGGCYLSYSCRHVCGCTRGVRLISTSYWYSWHI